MSCPSIRESRERLCAFRPALLAIAISMGCSSSAEEGGGSESRDAQVGSEAESAPSLYPSQIPADFTCEPTLESIRAGIFETSCAWDTCHGDKNTAWGLRLVGDVQSIYTELVNSEAGICPEWMLVLPGDPENSLLWNKLVQAEPACGERMPRGVEPLPQVALDCIRGWIEQL